MNLQPLYDLKERLEHAAIAGTRLLREDFRLARAIQSLEPLAKANPVFSKIGASAKALLAAPEGEQSVRLLDTLSLVDAVVYTQGVTGVTGELEANHPGIGSYVEATYSQLHPLIAALSGTGSGRIGQIRDTLATHPDYFADFRVLPHLVTALGDRDTELAQLAGVILQRHGATILPLLKAGFDPTGKAEMARRVRLIARISGAGENEWYRSVLPESEKDVRTALIQALSLSQDNAQLLLDLFHAEKGKLKEAALRSLAKMDSPAASEFWQKEFLKKPALADILGGVDSVLAADLTARRLRTALEEQLAQGPYYSSQYLQQFNHIVQAAEGKYSAEMANLWRWIASRMADFAPIKPEKHMFTDLSMAEHLQSHFLESLLCNSCPEMLSLAHELAEMCPDWFFCAGVLADIAALSAGEVYEKYESCFVPTGLLRRESDTEQNRRVQVLRAFAPISWQTSLESYAVSLRRCDSLTGEVVNSMRKLDSFDPRWVALLTDPKVQKDGDILILNSISGRTNLDTLLLQLIRPGEEAVCSPIGNYLHQKACKSGKIEDYFSALLRCGWQDWEGLMVSCVKESGEIRYDRMLQYYDRVPMPNVRKAAELRQLDELVKSGKVKVKMNLWLSENIQVIAARLEADPNLEILKKL